jgi:hypothetical protein
MSFSLGIGEPDFDRPGCPRITVVAHEKGDEAFTSNMAC